MDELNRAMRIEAIMPVVMRALFPADHLDPLAGVPLNQLRLLRLLDGHSLTLTEATRELGTSISALTQLVDRLEESGLIERSCDAHDRRVKHLRLSPLGAERMAIRRELRATRAAEVLQHMSETDQLALMEALESLLAASRHVVHQPNPAVDADVEQKSSR